MDGFPSGAEEGESLYHITEDAAYVYTGSSWVEQTVTNHGQLAGVSEGDHRSDTRVSEIAQNAVSVPNNTGSVGSSGGYVTIHNGSSPVNRHLPIVADSLRFYNDWSGSSQTATITLSNGNTVSLSAPEKSSRNKSFGTAYVIDVSVTDATGGSDIEVRAVALQNHTHNL
ncbi:hypothetical protein EXE43_08855 [Halorubrum sp. SS5]|nr:hypothetical protein EXE43_08855 [Halorubrum sp. SS5]